MVSSRRKGMNYEIEFEQILRGFGFVTNRVKGGTKFNVRNDFFGLWDVQAFNNKGWLLVQCKVDFRRKVFETLKSWYEENKPPLTTCIYAIRKKNLPPHLRWQIIYINKGLRIPLKEKKVKL